MRANRGRHIGRGIGWCIGIAGLALMATACSAADPQIPVVMNDFTFEPKQITIERGKKSILLLENRGSVEHNLAVQRQPLASQAVPPGRTVKMEVQLPPGNYPIICTVPGHEEAGMTGQITSARGR